MNNHLSFGQPSLRTVRSAMSVASERLEALRRELAGRGLDGFIVPRADEHLGEYVPASAERLAWLTGFTGSAGLAVVLPDCAAVFTDGRYVLQLATQTDAALWERRHITEEPPQTWLATSVTPEAAPGEHVGPAHIGPADTGPANPTPPQSSPA